jgi:hypothetical protein
MRTIFLSVIAICSCSLAMTQSPSRHYLFDTFQKGTILLNDGKKTADILNYNALTNEVVIKRDGQITTLTLSYVKKVDTIYVKGRKLIPYYGKFCESLINKEELRLLVDYECTLKSNTENRNPYGSSSQTSSPVTIGQVQDKGALYDLQLPELYSAELKYQYRYIKGQSESILKSMNQFKKLYPQHKKEFNKYKKENNVDFEDPLSVAKMISYFESLD